MKTGKVWLVGAGPSDPGLMTIKGRVVLSEAEVVVYDRLVGDGVMAMVNDSAKLICVGKKAGHHPVPQNDINEILLAEALAGKKVVRLKGGDPFLFGRGGEELELLLEHRIPYEIVPGITSAISVPAYQGIPVTHRDYSSSLHIVTGHHKDGSPKGIDYEALVRLDGTLVFLMGVKALEQICSGLISAGMDKEMPAALLQRGTTARQKRIVATIATLKSEVERQGSVTPAIIVIGRVCRLSERFSWLEALPLTGLKVAVTRPKELVSGMASKLRKQGAEVVELPAIKTLPIEPNPALAVCLKQIDSYQWLVLTSPTGVKVFFDMLLAERIDIRRLAGIKIAAVGPATQTALENRGLFVDIVPEVFDGGSLGKRMTAFCKAGDRILIPRAELGSNELIDALKVVENIHIDDICTYRTVYETNSWIDLAAAVEHREIDYVVFTSVSTVKGFLAMTPAPDYSKVKAVCIGRQTAGAAEAAGMEVFMSKKATMDDIVDLLIELSAKEQE